MTRTRDPKQKRAKLKDTALKLFKQKGFDNTATIEIARQSGVSEGVLFHQFGSKLRLFHSLAEDYVQSITERLALTACPPPQLPEYMIRSLFEVVSEDPDSYALFAEEGSKLDVLSTTHREAMVETLTIFVSSRMEAGAIRRGDAHMMSELQVIVVVGTLRAWRHSGDPDSKEAYIQEGLHSMKQMLAKA